MKLLVLLALICLALPACSGYNFSQAVYDGVKTRDTLNSTPAERLGQPDVNYDQYENERKRQQ